MRLIQEGHTMINRLLSKTTHRRCFLFLMVIVASSFYSSGKTLCAEPAQQQIDWEYQIAYQRGIEAMNWALPSVGLLMLDWLVKGKG